MGTGVHWYGVECDERWDPILIMKFKPQVAAHSISSASAMTHGQFVATETSDSAFQPDRPSSQSTVPVTLTAAPLIFTSSAEPSSPPPNFNNNNAKMVTIVGAIRPLVDDVIKCRPEFVEFRP